MGFEWWVFCFGFLVSIYGGYGLFCFVIGVIWFGVLDLILWVSWVGDLCFLVFWGCSFACGLLVVLVFGLLDFGFPCGFWGRWVFVLAIWVLMQFCLCAADFWVEFRCFRVRVWVLLLDLGWL